MKRIDTMSILDLILFFISNPRKKIEINVSIINKDGTRTLEILSGNKETLITFSLKILLLVLSFGLSLLSKGIINSNTSK